MRKLDFFLCESKGVDQLCSNCTADQHLCFRHSDSTISLQSSSETAQASLCQTWSETPKTGFLGRGSYNVKHVYKLPHMYKGLKQ